MENIINKCKEVSLLINKWADSEQEESYGIMDEIIAENDPKLFDEIEKQYDIQKEITQAAIVIGFHLGYHKRKIGNEGVMLHYDIIRQIAEAFVEKYPPSFNWEEFYINGGEDWDVTCEKFADQYILEHDIHISNTYFLE